MPSSSAAVAIATCSRAHHTANAANSSRLCGPTTKEQVSASASPALSFVLTHAQRLTVARRLSPSAARQPAPASASTATGVTICSTPRSGVSRDADCAWKNVAAGPVIHATKSWPPSPRSIHSSSAPSTPRIRSCSIMAAANPLPNSPIQLRARLQ
jgi:hypothetical protein